MVEPYRSPPGTYERIRKSVLEDTSLSDAELRVALHLATKPDGWEIHAEQVARDMGKPMRYVTRALTGLRRRGWVVVQPVRHDGGAFAQRGSVLIREKVVVTDVSAGQDQRAESGTVDVTCGNTQTPRSEPPCSFTTGGETAQPSDDGLTTSDGLSGEPVEMADENTATRGHAARGPAISDDFVANVAGELIDRLDADGEELSTIAGMLDSGAHPRAVENKIAADRRRNGRAR